MPAHCVPRTRFVCAKFSILRPLSNFHASFLNPKIPMGWLVTFIRLICLSGVDSLSNVSETPKRPSHEHIHIQTPFTRLMMACATVSTVDRFKQLRRIDHRWSVIYSVSKQPGRHQPFGQKLVFKSCDRCDTVVHVITSHQLYERNG